MENQVITKVKKLIALGTNEGATEGERENALRMAHGLLAKHNLVMEDITDSVEDRQRLVFEYKSIPWIGIVCNAVAKLFFCYLYVDKNYSEKKTRSNVLYCFIGKESNVVTARLMSEYIVRSIHREQTKGKFGHSFSNGASHKIWHRVMEIINSSKIESEDGLSSSTELALVSIYKSEEQANKEFVEKAVGKMVEAKTKKVKQNAADYWKGSEYAEGISLNGQISGNTGNKTQIKIG